MDDNVAILLRDSNKIISKLQLLSVFFEEDVIYKIYLRTQVIHKLFENNPDLDINKLELFHLQYTSTIVELLKKIKASNERNISILLDEIHLNKELIDNIEDSVFTEKNFNLDKQRQALKVNLSLRKLYQILSDNTDEDPFSKNINAFSARFSADFYYDIPWALFEELTTYNPKEVYRNSHATIQRKLMGVLCKTDFKSEFICGLASSHLVLEIYKLLEEDKHFLFLPSRNVFLFCDLSKINGIDWSNTMSKKARLKQELMDKNDQLQSAANITKTTIPDEIKNLIKDYYDKIDDVNFLQNISNFDVQANILKSMLNTNSI
ncbi:hypothetical protein SAMN05518672_105134 [Chitinophaga sp. CF118]|uniref:hypothetical protein n=1 Tax=Chitinophaga sp. CF118 TaxID=1884367 RepID=UPI0008DF6EAC|nr:hypothetical protein [Chitinophaga sp. CF118]SFE27637.1 hypothetical protein SAMN05518672_105134 [Chitinophaga sp. CF118]